MPRPTKSIRCACTDLPAARCRITPVSGARQAIARGESRWPVADDDAAADKVDQVRVHRPASRPLQPRLKPDIEPLDDRVDVPDTGAQTIEDAGLALAAMRNESADMGLRLGDCRSVGRPVDRVAAAEQFIE